MTAEQAALTLAEEYGLPVFPCRGDKQPHTQHGFKDASRNIEQITTWWQSWSDALIGVPTGIASKLLVVDIDPAGEDWYRENFARLAAGRIHKTQRGHHLLYAMPDALIRNSAGKIAPGVDVRGEGGYIIWWPAQGHETTGDLADIGPAPDWLIKQLTTAPERTAPTSNGNGRITEGGRNDAMTRLAGKMRRIGATQDEIENGLVALNERCDPPLGAAEIERIAGSIGRYAPASGAEAPTIQLRHLSDIIAECREPEWLRRNIIERNVLAVIAGARGTFKSFIGLDWMMHAAVAGHAGVILSGEGAGLDRRADAWLRTHAPDLDAKSLPVLALERALNLNAAGELEALRGAVRASGINPAVVMTDTFSKFAPGLDENDNAEVSAYLAGLTRGLRDEFGCTVLLVAHSGHADPRRPRGASVLMCNPDAEYVVQRPDPTAMTVTVTRERFKDSPALPPLAYAAEVVDLGRVDRYGDPVTSLALRETGCAPPVRPELRGRAQRQLLGALRAQEPGRIWTLADMREVGRQVGLSKATARSAAEALTFCAWTKATVGGWSLADE